MKRLSLLLFLVPACGGGGSDPCTGVTGKCVAISDGAGREEIQTAMIDATDPETIAFPAGTFDIDGELDLDAPGVTLLGQGPDQTILSFATQTTGGQGLYVTADRFTAQDIAFVDAPGDIVKVEGADKITFENVRAEYTNGPDMNNGSYAIYPVQCSNLHVDNSFARGASDTGIYVGQSNNVILEHNMVTGNVAGIEIENTTNADVHDNESTGNTGGILVFNLPGLQVERGMNTRIYANNVHENNLANFAPVGNIVGKVPAGTGIAALAAHDIEIFGNTIANHDSVNFGVISYTTTGEAYSDPNYDPDPDTIYFHDNTLTGTSANPTGPLGALLIEALLPVISPVVVPDMIWDGVVPSDPTDPRLDPNDPTQLDATYAICLKNNGDADFSNLRYPADMDPVADFDATPHDCTHPALPAIVLQ